jgi:hypothetical protein
VNATTIGICMLADYFVGLKTANKLSGIVVSDSSARLIFLS